MGKEEAVKASKKSKETVRIVIYVEWRDNKALGRHSQNWYRLYLGCIKNGGLTHYKTRLLARADTFTRKFLLFRIFEAIAAISLVHVQAKIKYRGRRYRNGHEDNQTFVNRDCVRFNTREGFFLR